MMTDRSKKWTILNAKSDFPVFKNPIMIEGMPGIGNVGKIVADFLIDELKAKKLCEFFSYSLPNSVFVTEDNLVELPRIEMYYYKSPGQKNQDILILTGDIQPMDEESCYEFCDEVINFFLESGGTDIITLGGIGLATIPKKPNVFCTANNKNIIKKYSKKTRLNNNLYGIVGPIVGVSGLLIGLAAKRNVDAMALLAETYGHPMYIGIKGARKILKILNTLLDLDLDEEKLEKEIKSMENEILQRTSEFVDFSGEPPIKKFKDRLRSDMRYIG